MPIEFDLRVSPETAAKQDLLQLAAAGQMDVPAESIRAVQILRRSVDARKSPVWINLRIAVFIAEDPPAFIPPPHPAIPVPVLSAERARQRQAIVVGAGPAGLFAAIALLEKGIQPILLERGKAVRERRRDLALLNREHVVHPDSNYCFGEGGAGTYSDGKLYTRSKKRGDVRQVLEWLVAFGASEEILIDAHPHIGTNKLPGIIENIRHFILARGGQIHFDKRVSRLLIQAGRIDGVECADGSRIQAPDLILATGHSARDVYRMLQEQGIALQAKAFAMGVRVEHPQALIDRIQYHLKPDQSDRGPWLDAAPYTLTRQVKGRGVYSFCMCPGGIIAPCATAPGEVVTNGWSPSKRDQPWANSGIVVEIKPEDWGAFNACGALAGMEFQSSLEQACWLAAGQTQRVPAQGLSDFVQNRPSSSLGPSSYVPGTTPCNLNKLLPQSISRCLVEGFRYFGQVMRGYICEEAIVHAPESRTSSPVRIPRDEHNRQHPGMPGLYPVGEGAGYAGGIVSAAVDGLQSARMIGKNA